MSESEPVRLSGGPAKLIGDAQTPPKSWWICGVAETAVDQEGNPIAVCTLRADHVDRGEWHQEWQAGELLAEWSGR